MKYSLAEIQLGYGETLNIFCSDKEYLRSIKLEIENKHPVSETKCNSTNDVTFKFEKPRGMWTPFPCYAAENYAKLIMLEDGWEPFSIVPIKSGDSYYYNYCFRKSF